MEYMWKLMGTGKKLLPSLTENTASTNDNCKVQWKQGHFVKPSATASQIQIKYIFSSLYTYTISSLTFWMCYWDVELAN